MHAHPLWTVAVSRGHLHPIHHELKLKPARDLRLVGILWDRRRGGGPGKLLRPKLIWQPVDRYSELALQPLSLDKPDPALGAGEVEGNGNGEQTAHAYHL